eukprot:scaffold25.g5085.t1
MVAAGLRALFHVYASSLRRHPWRTQVVTTGALWCCGDLLAQRLEARASGRAAVWDARRTALTAGYGGLFIGPLGHAWYLGLDVAARRLLSPGTAGFIAGKVLADTFLFGPVYTLGFFATVALGEGGGWEGVRAKVAQDFAPAFLAEVAVWPAVQTLNFRLVPVEYQLLVVNAVTVLDAAFMSYAGNNETTCKYSVKAGDDDWKLETLWNLTHGSLPALNPGVNWTNLQARGGAGGLQLCANCTQALKPGQNFYTIEIENSWEVGVLATLNPGVDPNNMADGTVFRVPCPHNLTSCDYKIQGDDDFWKLENRLNLPHGTLAKLNPTADQQNLQTNQIIHIC